MQLDADRERSIEEKLAELLEKYNVLVKTYDAVVVGKEEVKRRLIKLEALFNEMPKEYFRDFITDESVAEVVDMTKRGVDNVCKQYGVIGFRFGRKVLYVEADLVSKTKEHPI